MPGPMRAVCKVCWLKNLKAKQTSLLKVNYLSFRDGPLEKWLGGGGWWGKKQKKFKQGKLSRKKFVQEEDPGPVAMA